MPSLDTYRLTWVSLTLNEGYLLTVVPPDLERGVAPLGHAFAWSVAAAATARF